LTSGQFRFDRQTLSGGAAVAASAEACTHPRELRRETEEGIVCSNCGLVISKPGVQVVSDFVQAPFEQKDHYRVDDVRKAADDDQETIVNESVRIQNRIEKERGGRIDEQDAKFIRRHKPKQRKENGGEQFVRNRKGSKRYKADYLLLIDESYLAILGGFEYRQRFLPDDAAPKDITDLYVRCISDARKSIDSLLCKFRKKTGKPDLGDWRLDYKLDLKVYVATLVLCFLSPPDSKKGYEGRYLDDNDRAQHPNCDFATRLLDSFKSRKVLTSCIAPHRLVRLEVDMWKAYLDI
jgi:hypothetical protein